MNEDVESLSDRERETLSLLGRGHEAKSIAAALGISVHSVNERLRAARRKLGVSSSREAARLLLANEGPTAPENFGYKEIGVAPAGAGKAYSPPAHWGATDAKRRATWVMIGAVMLTVVVAVLIAANSGGSVPAGTPYGPRNAEPISSLPSLFAVSDYPAEALAKGAQGITDFRLQVSADGRVEKCAIERSSGNAALDAATCRVITKRSRFRPAVDAAGHAVDSTYTGMIHWIL
jgi:TonB family protein